MTYQPENPDKYSGNQIIFSSPRIVLIGKKDSILLSANKSIALSSNTSLNFDTKGKFVVEAPKIEFGTNAKDALLLGTKFNHDIMEKLLDALMNLATILETCENGPIGTPNFGLNIAGTQLKSVLPKLKKTLIDTLSKITYIK